MVVVTEGTLLLLEDAGMGLVLLKGLREVLVGFKVEGAETGMVDAFGMEDRLESTAIASKVSTSGSESRHRAGILMRDVSMQLPIADGSGCEELFVIIPNGR